MSHRTIACWLRATSSTAALLLLAGAPSVAFAQARSLGIPECAKASTIRSTIDPSKPDAKRKAREADLWERRCRKIMQSAPPRPKPTAAVPSPRPSPQPPPQPAPPRRRSLLEQLVDLGKQRQRQAPSAPAAPPPRATAPRVAPGPWSPPPPPAAPPAPVRAATPAPAVAPPAAEPAPSAPAPAVVALTPAAFVPSAPQPSTARQRKVFELELGEPLQLPQCAPGIIKGNDAKAFESGGKAQVTAVAESCVDAGAGVRASAQRIADFGSRPLPPGIKMALARISPQHCPSWVSGSCTVSLALQGNVLVGVAFLTAEDSERTVARLLRGAYGVRPASQERSACHGGDERRQGSDVTWAFADLTVQYWSVGGLSCGQGRVLVRTEALEQLLREPRT